MCGISGYVGIDDPDLLRRMNAAIAHRGPDGEGTFREADMGLGHRRLSIIDLEGGQQPIYNEDDSLVLVANGEIYNYRALRDELVAKGHRFSTNSDSEVLIHLYEEHGPEMLPRLNGMFAFAIWDRNARRLFLARDRIGIKPLYVLEQGATFLFASEIKALLEWRGYTPRIDPDALDAYLSLRYVPGPGSLLRGIAKLPAAHHAIIEAGAMRLTRWWSPALHTGPFEGDAESWLEEFSHRFKESVARRMMADVPVGAYLSAGVDSSVVVADMAKLSQHPIRTYSVGFDFAYDESAEARATADLLGCDHTALHYTASDVALLPDLVWHLDEPVGDPIIIPMFRLAKTARQDVKVVLTGEGADETLGGYVYQKVMLQAVSRTRRVPAALLRGGLVPLLAATPSRVLDLAFDYPARLGRRGKQKVVDLARLLAARRHGDAYRHLLSLFDDRDKRGLYSAKLQNHLSDDATLVEPDLDLPSEAPLLNRLIDWSFAHWLPDDILCKQDKLSMAHGLEARVPFLDHELVEFGLRIPPELKIRGQESKHLLRRYAATALPPAVAHRKKVPFYVPFENYLQDPTFTAMLDDTLSPRAVAHRGFFRPEAIDRLRQSLRGGEFLHAKQAFSLVTLELWCRRFLDRRGA